MNKNRLVLIVLAAVWAGAAVAMAAKELFGPGLSGPAAPVVLGLVAVVLGIAASRAGTKPNGK